MERQPRRGLGRGPTVDLLLRRRVGGDAAVHCRARPAPLFTDRGDGLRAALVRDPDGEWVELVIDSTAAAEELDRFEIGLNVSDLARSRAFYRDFLGMAEQGSAPDPRLGADRHAFRHGTTTINLWSTTGRDLPTDTQTAASRIGLLWKPSRA